MGVDPDIAVFAKGLSNGYAMAAVLGRAKVMQAAHDTFISSTYWTERIGPAAALATIRKHQRCNVARHLIRIGERVQAGWRQVGQAVGLKMPVDGVAPLGHFAFEHPQGQALMTLFTQEMLARGFLAKGAFYATYAHTDRQVDDYLAAAEEVCRWLARVLAENRVEAALQGPVAHQGFQRLT